MDAQPNSPSIGENPSQNGQNSRQKRQFHDFSSVRPASGQRPRHWPDACGRLRTPDGHSKNHEIGVSGVNFIRFDSDFHRSMGNLIVHSSKNITNRTKCQKNRFVRKHDFWARGRTDVRTYGRTDGRTDVRTRREMYTGVEGVCFFFFCHPPPG